ncbi:MAG: L,D-transpeptidase [Chloroflexi bacterium]|nr:L,D-transpeptidase [Chloroflexota bacterium]
MRYLVLSLVLFASLLSFEPSQAQGHPSCAGISRETPMTPECAALIAARPTPNVNRVPVDLGVVSDDRFLMFTRNDVPLYDAPGGQQIDTLVTGYTYVTPVRISNGWAQLATGTWFSLEDARLVSPSTASGVLINGPLDMPFAWVLWEHDATSTPAGLPDRESGRYHRYQVVNIYATVNINGWDWHLIGPNHWTNQKNLSIVYPPAPASFDGRWVGVNLYEQNLVAYENNVPVMAALVSSGLKNGRWDTPTGAFQVGVRLEADRMSGAERQPDYYSLDQVPYAQYFNGLISLHGTYWHDSFGYPQSHGCVNLSVSDAKWLFEYLAEGSVVYVYDS